MYIARSGSRDRFEFHREDRFMRDQAKRVALITGANKGIGLEVARCLGQGGLIVLIGARNPELGQAATAQLKAVRVDARYVELDVVRQSTIAAAASMIATEFGRLDVLINNAGINAPGDGPPGSADFNAVRRVMETNFFGALTVTQAMLPLLRKSLAGRIVNVLSGLGSLNWNADLNWEFAPVKLIG